jgi:dTDP-glucose 4,6-dehydratase
MHIFVTGGTGFFGKALLRHWASGYKSEFANAKFTLLSREPNQFIKQNSELLLELNVRLVQGDVQKPETLPEDDYTHVIHAATDSTRGLDLTPLKRFYQIVDGTRNVLDLAVRCKKPKLLMISSGGVYGRIDQFSSGVPESFNGMPDPSNPHNAYSIAKRQAEHLCTLYQDTHGLEYVIARCFSFIGEDLPINAHFAIGNFIRDAISGKDIVIKGDGLPIRSYMDQRDLAQWLSTLLVKGKTGKAYNVGSGEAISIAMLADRIASSITSHRPRVRILKQVTNGQSASRDFYLPDVRRARDEMGLRCEIGLDESVCNVVSHYQKNKILIKS